MQPMKGRRWQIVGAALVLFAVGCLVGALSMNLYHRRNLSGSDWSRRAAFDKALKQISLNADQQAKVDAILADTRNQLREVRKEESPRVGEIRRKTRERLQSVLTPDQWHQLQEQMKSVADRRNGERSSLHPEEPLE